jgi:acetyl-CoA carboxylase biotin carboxylase subunit
MSANCSIQRRHQKISRGITLIHIMTPELRHKMGEAALKPASAINYESVGTIEFLVDKHRNVLFHEMNTRIQVEHCVTERWMNYDLIKRTDHRSRWENLISGMNYEPEMHAIECRINAEEPYNDFRPAQAE